MKNLKCDKTMCEKKPKILCKWLNQSGNPCPWRSLENKLYCKRHSIYEDIFLPEDIKFLSKCSCCKNMFKKSSEYKICDKCRSYNKKRTIKKRQTKIYCKAITQSKTKCDNKPLENDEYCGEHQTYKKWKELTDSGKKVCADWIRGCFEIILTKNSYCTKCRGKYRIKENKIINAKRVNAVNFNKENMDTKMCRKCNNVYNKKIFTNLLCHKCYNSMKIVDENRNIKNPYYVRYQSIIQSANKRNLDVKIPKNDILKIIGKSCYYCGKKATDNHPLGLDRLDSSKSYISDNCVSCCKICNICKQTLTENQFIENIKIILKNKNILDNIIVDKNKGFFETAIKPVSFKKFKNQALYRNLSCDFNEEYYNKLLTEKCFYCENHNKYGAKGIDRIDSKQSYIMSNSVSCCKTCNIMKSSLSITEFYNHLKKIYNNYVINIKEKITLKEKIINKFLETSKLQVKLSHERFLHSKEYYKNLVWDLTFDDLRKIKIKLEIINSKDQEKMDIWNFYRRTVSSFQINNSSKLVGRQIYILVKDEYSNKYLGIISLSSDVYSITARDIFIDWDSETKKEKLNYILNLTTCVPLQPFGYKFNGGKLLAELVFSKEIFKEFKKRYNIDLIAITTFGLYGKAIMYDRLRKLKFIGYTKGNSYCNIDDETYNLCKQFLKENNFDYKKYKRFMNIRKTLDMLKLNKCILTSNKKSCYIGFFNKENINFLNNTNKTILKPTLESSSKIFKWWLNRWAEQRYKHLIKTNRLNDKFYSTGYLSNKKYEENLIKKIGIDKFRERNKIKAKKWRDKNRITTQILKYNNINYTISKNIYIKKINDNDYLVFRKLVDKKNYKVVKIINDKIAFIDQLKLFINIVNSKYENINISTEIKQIEESKEKDFKLPKCFSITTEKGLKYIIFQKKFNEKRYVKKFRLHNENIKQHYLSFKNKLILTNPELKELLEENEKKQEEKILPKNISIINVKGDKYLLFQKNINGKRIATKMKINNNLPGTGRPGRPGGLCLEELLPKFIEKVNSKFNQGLIGPGWSKADNILGKSSPRNKVDL